MLAETVKYLLGSAGPSGFGSASTADDVTAAAAHHLGAITAIITGATSGIGFETARALAARGARLILPARNPDAAEEVKSRIAGGGQIIVLPLDLSSFSSVRSFVSQFLALGFPLNILINNAGRFAYDQAESEDGIELTFAINFLGPFLLTKLLLEKMVVSARETGIEGRIVNVGSFCHRWFSGDPLGYLRLLAAGEVRYNAARAYGLSKLAMVMHTKELARRLEKMGVNVTVNSVDPGITRTRLNRDREGFVLDMMFFLASKFVKTIHQAAATTCYVAVHPAVAGASGKYYADCNESAAAKSAANGEMAAQLWIEAEAMIADADLDGSESDPAGKQ
ncbi:hypothetical protein IEQ34_015961 [Dendrobium chrysotoxum]|uniref:Uncharacterized protein n=1 Tax=Dendrobium chrysotoxum TaxID=161865 RepID=A0AAV7GJW8_DENCH|nr:hypothetical protein IEQ34_015961 [Dendrobium chrysotoxum]